MPEDITYKEGYEWLKEIDDCINRIKNLNEQLDEGLLTDKEFLAYMQQYSSDLAVKANKVYSEKCI